MKAMHEMLESLGDHMLLEAMTGGATGAGTGSATGGQQEGQQEGTVTWIVVL